MALWYGASASAGLGITDIPIKKTANCIENTIAEEGVHTLK